MKTKVEKIIQNLTKKFEKIKHIKDRKSKNKILLRYFDRL